METVDFGAGCINQTAEACRLILYYTAGAGAGEGVGAGAGAGEGQKALVQAAFIRLQQPAGWYSSTSICRSRRKTVVGFGVQAALIRLQQLAGW